MGGGWTAKMGGGTFAAFAVATFCVWLQLFHDGGSTFGPLMDDLLVGGHPIGIYFNCFASPLGFAGGAVVALCALHSRRMRVFVPSPAVAFALLLALHGLFYGCAALTRSYILISIVSFAVGVVGVSFLLFHGLRWVDFGKTFITGALLVYIVGQGFASTLLAACFPANPLSYGLGSLLFLAPMGAFALAKRHGIEQGRSEGCGMGESSREEQGAPPANGGPAPGERPARRWPRLLLHLACYGVGFGVIHAMIGFDAESSMTLSMTAPVVCARLLGFVGAALLAYASLHYISRVDDMWLIVRGAVFPLLVIGYTLVVITSTAFVPSIIVSVGANVYDAAFLLGCLMMHRETGIGLRTIVAIGFGTRELGFFAGAVVGFLLGDYGAIANQTESAVALLVVFSVLSVGTFWIGSERDMRKWWGLRTETSPEYQRESVLREKSRQVAAECGLSAREAEILFLVACGKRPAQIADEQCLSVFTVRNHIQSIYRKLDVHSREEVDALLVDRQVLM